MNLEEAIRVIDFRHVTRKTAEDVWDYLLRFEDWLNDSDDPDLRRQAIEVSQTASRFREETGL